MACKVTYLSSGGIHHREVKGIDALSAVLPAHWLMYASLSAFPPNSSPIQIDVLLVMDDRVLLLEMKDWHGELTSEGDRWFVNRKPRGTSPVDLGADKARKIKGLIAGRIPQLAHSYVDSMVVLTGTATPDSLHDADRSRTLTLAQARSLADPAARARLLAPVKLTRAKPSQYAEQFDALLRTTRLFQPRKMDWEGYTVLDEDLFIHRKDVFREHRSENARDGRLKALLRLWRFDQLPAGLNEPNNRRLVAEREGRVSTHLEERGSWLTERSALLRPIHVQADEVLTQHHQLFAIPPGWTTLRRYLGRVGGDLTDEQRLDMMHALVALVAELHRHRIAHRDLGIDAIWIGSPTRLALTGFAASRLGDETSVAEWFDHLRTYAEPEPETPGAESGAWERDVRSLGLIMREISAFDGGGGPMEIPAALNGILSTAVAQPGCRYLDAVEMADAIGELRDPSLAIVDQSRLDVFQTNLIPFVAWPPSGEMTTNGRSTRYVSIGAEGERRTVKTWAGVVRGASAAIDHAMLAMLEGASGVVAAPVPGVVRYEAAALSPTGPYVVSSWVDGVTLGESTIGAILSLVDVCLGLCVAINALHTRGLAHGDLSPANVIVDLEGLHVTLIDVFDLAAVGAGAVNSPSYSPVDRERRTDEQIDRYAACLMIRGLFAARTDEGVSDLRSVLDGELARPAVETLDPAVDGLCRLRLQLSQPHQRRFRLIAPGLPQKELTGDEGSLHVQAHFLPSSATSYIISGLDMRILLHVSRAGVEKCEAEPLRLNALGRGVAVPMSLTIAPGPVSGGVELAEYLATVVAPSPRPPDADGATPRAAFSAAATSLDIARLWRRSVELEEDLVPEVRIGRRIADQGNTAMFRYETLASLEFDEESVVELREGRGSRGRVIAMVDVGRSDAGALALTGLRRHVADGEIASLVDRRDRISKERRRRAVERIVQREAPVRDLIDFFDPVSAIVGAPDAAGRVPTLHEMEQYGLNEGQREAFVQLLAAGPVGLLQGPPGSGKTRFVAAMAHWLLTAGGVRKLLIASQSHEAVNGVTEELIRTFGRREDRVDLLRIGSRGVTDAIRPYQAPALRERYRQRFENGIKARLAAAAGAAGIPRIVTHDVVEIERRLGEPCRARLLVAEAARAAGATAEDQQHAASRLRELDRSIAAAARDLLGRDIGEVDQPSMLVEESYAALLLRHPKITPGDVAMTRRLFGLSREWIDTLGTGHRNFDEFLAKTRSVVTGTCVGIGQSKMRLDAGSFDWVIVDEAARCTSGELAIPIQLGRRVILVGDHRQLLPMVDREVVGGLVDEMPGVGRDDIERSDFERAFTSRNGLRHGQVLTEQYRMAPAICNLVSKVFYAPHGVVLAPSPDRVADAAFARLEGVLRPPVTWFDTSAGRGERSRNRGRDIWNDDEAEAVMALLETYAALQTLVAELAARRDPAIGVICMYSEQKRRLEREWFRRPFDERFRRLVRIDTVDAYQGKENSIVMLSLVRSNPARNPGHVGIPNRCNVAMSRAKERLHVFGDAAMWRSVRGGSPMGSVLELIAEADDATARLVPADAASC